jgi:UDP-N-acetylglucosamine transferase subunit ALG13
MILVTVGNAFQPFTRLLRAVDALAGEGVFQTEAVLMQTGHAGYSAGHAEARAFWPIEEFERSLSEATLIISHGGCTVLEAVARGKLPVVMPRSARYGEHVNDHQIRFARALAAQGRALVAYEPEELKAAVQEALRRGGRQTTALPPSQIHELVRRSLVELAGEMQA